ncbi:hypothetical protein BC937DRAFT_93390 [Endogone sp. FLAS-F59071]|nr:hypothetical protein BC937DRAFT_93390 [Endogone sp. FLAS-F59071]|eukprot:RUS14753.1 hypothetical protein BC937DRAFT_93390 [Endogone sp. FLAS-F59071]
MLSNIPSCFSFHLCGITFYQSKGARASTTAISETSVAAEDRHNIVNEKDPSPRPKSWFKGLRDKFRPDPDEPLGSLGARFVGHYAMRILTAPILRPRRRPPPAYLRRPKKPYILDLSNELLAHIFSLCPRLDTLNLVNHRFYGIVCDKLTLSNWALYHQQDGDALQVIGFPFWKDEDLPSTPTSARQSDPIHYVRYMISRSASLTHGQGEYLIQLVRRRKFRSVEAILREYEHIFTGNIPDQSLLAERKDILRELMDVACEVDQDGSKSGGICITLSQRGLFDLGVMAHFVENGRIQTVDGMMATQDFAKGKAVMRSDTEGWDVVWDAFRSRSQAGDLDMIRLFMLHGLLAVDRATGRMREGDEYLDLLDDAVGYHNITVLDHLLDIGLRHFHDLRTSIQRALSPFAVSTDGSIILHLYKKGLDLRALVDNVDELIPPNAAPRTGPVIKWLRNLEEDERDVLARWVNWSEEVGAVV